MLTLKWDYLLVVGKFCR